MIGVLKQTDEEYAAWVATPDYLRWKSKFKAEELIRQWNLSPNEDRFKIWFQNRKYVSKHNDEGAKRVSIYIFLAEMQKITNIE